MNMRTKIERLMGIALIVVAGTWGGSGVAREAVKNDPSKSAQIEGYLQTWKKTHSPVGKCRMAFPSDPQHMQQQMHIPEQNLQLQYDVYVSGLDRQGVYMLLVAQYPSLLDEQYAQLSLEGFLNGLISQNPSNRLIFADLVEIDGHKGLDFFIRTKGVYFKGRAIMAHNNLYLLAMECEMQQYKEHHYKYFIESFEFTR